MRKRTSIFAWMVHALTASGALLAFLAFVAMEQAEWRLALCWLAAALIVDGIDGPLARIVDVKRNTPRIDGNTLDLVVDYLTYVFLPTIFIYRAGLIPAGPFALVLVALVQFSSLYHYARLDLKTPDNYFVGFPAMWNIVAFYLFMAQPGTAVGAVTIIVLAALTFMPVYFVHPVRVRDFRPWLTIAAAVWVITSAALLWPHWSAEAAAVLLTLSLAGAAALVAMGLLRTLRGQAPAVRAAA
jgi:phosphatidylcholine synthase